MTIKKSRVILVIRLQTRGGSALSQRNFLVLPNLEWFGEGDKPETTLDDIDAIMKDVDKLTPEEMKVLLKKQQDKIQILGSKSKELLHEVMDKKDKIKKIDEEKEAARLLEMKQKEDYKKLAETLEAENVNYKQKLEMLTLDSAKNLELHTGELNDLKASLPTEYQGLIPQVNVRDQILWIKDFKKSVVDKTPPANTPPVDTSAGNPTPPVRTVGNLGTPTGTPPNPTGKATLLERIAKCNSSDELETLQNEYARTQR